MTVTLIIEKHSLRIGVVNEVADVNSFKARSPCSECFLTKTS